MISKRFISNRKVTITFSQFVALISDYSFHFIMDNFLHKNLGPLTLTNSFSQGEKKAQSKTLGSDVLGIIGLFISQPKFQTLKLMNR